jgi:uncharacterized LabA/DUF88 family protein
MQRAIAYIDGFNLYYGLREKGWRRYYWLNLEALVRSLLHSDQELVSVKYFTALVSSTLGDPDKSKRQTTFIEALKTLPRLQVFFGHYLQKQVRCLTCGATWFTHEEKKTDVNIAVEMMTDAFGDLFDMAFLISGDSDLTDVVQNIRARFPSKRIVMAFPPARHSGALSNVASSSFTIGRAKLAQSQFPDSVFKADGFELRRPASWH